MTAGAGSDMHKRPEEGTDINQLVVGQPDRVESSCTPWVARDKPNTSDLEQRQSID